MKIAIPGGSGQVGTILAREFHAEGHEVVVLSRAPASAPWKMVLWDAETLGEWVKELDGADVVINLAGRSVNCRYHAANRREIMDSRVNSTVAVGQAIAAAAKPPRVWLQASTATIYAHRFDAANDEATGILGGSVRKPTPPPGPLPEAERGRVFHPPRFGEGGSRSEPGGVSEATQWNFSIDVAKAWEAVANEADTPHTRKVLLRSAVTMSPDRGGIFDVMLGLVRKGLGGTSGDGRQFVSWIHDRDFVRAVKWLIEREEFAGPVNLASPNPLPNAEFMRELRRAWGTRIGLPATRWMLGIGAFLMRTETELVLKSRRVVPGKLLNSGFVFEFPHWRDAAVDLCRRWRLARYLDSGSGRPNSSKP